MAGFEDGTRDCEPRSKNSLQKVEKTRKQILPWSRLENAVLQIPCFLVQQDPFWISDFQRYKW